MKLIDIMQDPTISVPVLVQKNGTILLLESVINENYILGKSITETTEGYSIGGGIIYPKDSDGWTIL